MYSRKVLALAPALCLMAGSAMAQTAVGTGVGVSNSNSQSGAVAIAGQGGRSAAQANGNGGNAALTVNSNVPAATTSNINQNLTGTSTVKNVPSAYAPGLAAAGLETCLGSVSGGASVVGFGGSFGTTVPDPGCAARLDARTLWSFGLKGPALARLCITPEVYRSMPGLCDSYMPHAAAPVGVAYASVQPGVYTGGPIELIDGRTGLDRTCNDYNEVRRRCRQWADGGPVMHVTHKRLAAATVVAKKPATEKKAMAASPSAAPAVEPKKEN